MNRITLVICLTFLLNLIIHQPIDAQLDRDVVKLFEAVGAREGSKLGYKVAGLGDQNGDGYDDFLASAPGDRKAFLFFGGNPIDTIPDLVFHEENEEMFSSQLCNLGDVNDDSYADFRLKHKS